MVLQSFLSGRPPPAQSRCQHLRVPANAGTALNSMKPEAIRIEIMPQVFLFMILTRLPPFRVTDLVS